MTEEAEAFEDTLATWFNRLARRQAAEQPVERLREQLIFVMCKYARSLQMARFRSAPPSEELNTALSRSAEEVAFSVIQQFGGQMRTQ